MKRKEGFGKLAITIILCLWSVMILSTGSAQASPAVKPEVKEALLARDWQTVKEECGPTEGLKAASAPYDSLSSLRSGKYLP